MTRDAIVRELEGLLGRIVWIRDGDDSAEQDHALEDLEHDFAGFLERVRAGEANSKSFLCPDCTLTFDFPGRLADHHAVAHGVLIED